MTKELIFNTLATIAIAASEGGVPSGHVYARLMGDMDLATYQRILQLAVDSGIVTVRSHYVELTPKCVALSTDVRKAVSARARLIRSLARLEPERLNV